MPQSPRVLVADDDASMRASIVRLLSPACELVGDAADTSILLELAPRLRPDVVVLDFSLRGDVNALDACRRIRETVPGVQVVVFTADDDAAVKSAAYEAGASGFVWKLHAAEELLRTIQRVTEGAAGSATGGVA